MSNEKILELNRLSEVVRELRRSGKSIVHCHGVFDLLHVGHVRHFKQARALGDVLVVTLTEDRFVNKGPHRPAFDDRLRAEQVAALEAVAFVAINRAPTAVPAIEAIAPDVYVKGPDYRNAREDVTGGIALERAAVERTGGRVAFTEDLVFSSSHLMNRFLPSFGEDVERYLDGFRQRHGSAEVVEALERVAELRAVVVGEAILDEYVYCDQMGKSAKEPVLAMRYASREMFAGGALAVANHAAAFCTTVDLFTTLGDRDAHEAFVREHLAPNVRLHVLYKADSPTIVKRRYVESYLLSKLFEVYTINDEQLDAAQSIEAVANLTPLVEAADATIVADFGHGLMTEPVVDALARRPKFLAVNTQINAANIGFHAISNYPRADFVCIHEGEVRLDARSRRGDLPELASRLAERLNAGAVLVTRGKRGATLFSSGGVHDAPAFATTVLDRIGSGDAVLAVTSLCARAGVDPDVVVFLANVIGALKVRIMGNRSSVDRVATIKAVESLLK